MLEVLVHRFFLGSRSLVFLLAFFTLVPHHIAAQAYINGQTFTNGLAIIDSPSPSNPGHAGSDPVDVSGNGKLPPAASLPGSGLSTCYESLEIYLVSAQTNINMTVAAGPALLSGDSGSTVRHLNWPIPPCIPAGDYNLTFYETSHFNVLSHNVRILILLSHNLKPRTLSPNHLSPQVQRYPCQSSLSSSSSSSSSRAGMITVIGAGPNPLETLTLTISGGILNLPTVTVTAKPTPTTVVLISVATVTKTDQGGWAHRTIHRTIWTIHRTIRPIWFHPSKRRVQANEFPPVIFWCLDTMLCILVLASCRSL
ncbi:hypothetical protein DFH09DRAFT_310100 [Mycena vulgaris]|nr:hypothetical protein DFH09DRAFT_310100 [Mycena vulgaris]